MPHTPQQMSRRSKWFGKLNPAEQRQWVDLAEGVAFAVCMGLSCHMRVTGDPSAGGPQLWTPDRARRGDA